MHTYKTTTDDDGGGGADDDYGYDSIQQIYMYYQLLVKLSSCEI